jgi:hypothetical protein
MHSWIYLHIMIMEITRRAQRILSYECII